MSNPPVYIPVSTNEKNGDMKIEMNETSIQFQKQDPVAPVSTNFVQAFLATLCCFVPFGLVALVYSILAKDNVEIGRYDDARRQSTRSKYWTKFSVLIGVLLILLVVGFQLAARFYFASMIENNQFGQSHGQHGPAHGGQPGQADAPYSAGVDQVPYSAAGYQPDSIPN